MAAAREEIYTVTPRGLRVCDIMYDIMYDINMNSAVGVVHCRFKRRMFKIGDGHLAPSSTRPSSSSAPDASRLAILGPSQASLVVVGPPTRPSLSSSSFGAGGRASVAALPQVAPAAQAAQAPGAT